MDNLRKGTNKNSNINWTNELDKEILRLHFEEKISLTKIQKQLGISSNALSRRIKFLGYEPINYQNQKAYTKEDIQNYIKQGLTLTDIAKIYGISGSQLTPFCQKHRISIDRFDHNIFDKIDNEEKAYWLGFLYADGNISNKGHLELSLKASDKRHLEKFATFMKSSIEKVKIGTVTCSGKQFSRCRICYSNTHMKERLFKIGLIPRKSLTVKFPDKSIFKSEKLIIDFIRGYFDGDGCFTRRVGVNVVAPLCSILGTFEFLQVVQQYLFRHNIDCKLFKDKRHVNNTWTLSFNTHNTVLFINYIYKNASVYLDRKYNLYEFFKNGSRSVQEWAELLLTKNGELCDENTVVTEETKESSAPYSVEIETDLSE